MSSIPDIIAKPATPETVTRVRQCLIDIQTKLPHAPVCSALVFDRLIAEYSHAPHLPSVMKSITDQMGYNYFFTGQLTKLAELIVNRFSCKMVDPDQFVAMGGCPADEEVIIIDEDLKEKRMDTAHKALVSAIKKLTDALEEGEKSRKNCNVLGKRLFDLTVEHEHAQRDVQIKTVTVKNAQTAVKAAEKELDDATKEQEASKKPRRQ
jgi:hypothetical protein